MSKLILVLFLVAATFITGCHKGLTREQTKSVLKVFWAHKEELQQAKDKGVFEKDYVASMNARDEEAEKLLKLGAGYEQKK